jgi:hypothetical protein
MRIETETFTSRRTIAIYPFVGHENLDMSFAYVSVYQEREYGEWLEPVFHINADVFMSADELMIWVSAMNILTEKVKTWIP